MDLFLFELLLSNLEDSGKFLIISLKKCLIYSEVVHNVENEILAAKDDVDWFPIKWTYPFFIFLNRSWNEFHRFSMEWTNACFKLGYGPWNEVYRFSNKWTYAFFIFSLLNRTAGSSSNLVQVDLCLFFTFHFFFQIGPRVANCSSSIFDQVDLCLFYFAYREFETPNSLHNCACKLYTIPMQSVNKLCKVFPIVDDVTPHASAFSFWRKLWNKMQNDRKIP